MGNNTEPMKKDVDVKKLVSAAFNKALESQYPVAKSIVASYRGKNPGKTPKQAIAYLKKLYLSSVGVSGFASGASAAIPNGVGQVTVTVADLCNYLESSVLYVFSVAHVYGLDLSDEVLRRFLALVVLVGDSSATTVVNALGKKTVPYWSAKIIDRIPMSSLNAVNKILGKRFITKYGTKQGVLVLGKQLPFLIGAGVGVAGNEVFGAASVKAVTKFLGPVPDTWSE
ncbi:hypothetical protein OZX62_02715 [Bifidobacterium sp. ESL0690]|uniref:hypothetical protein n=1 Tax=Bifidobacterium sp. ESL0690 TaxID=2983214 RepID=UPI0023F6B30B|nr:hypothetical protein [Bifidobacterium sp. ESL0690]WEV47214.1 hypothetical protein OZX62_02715 [Bifidobacterium sp. ESL0690]